MLRTKILPICFLAMVFSPLAWGQDEEKIKQLFEDAIQAMGGEAFLNVTDMTSNGRRFFFDREGRSSNLIKFTDYTKLPDKSRFESGNDKKHRDITVFNLSTNEGWIQEAYKETREATKEEMEGFKNAVKHSLDIIFRLRYKDPENKAFYLGPGEGRFVTFDLVRLVDPDNDEITIYFDRMSKLPAKVEYWESTSRGVRVRAVDEFSQWHVIQGVNTPKRVDGYVNDRRAFQYFILDITYNNDLEDSLFTKPLPPD